MRVARVLIVAMLAGCLSAGGLRAQGLLTGAERLAQVVEMLLPLTEAKLAKCRQPESLTIKARSAILSARAHITMIKEDVQKTRSGDERAMRGLADLINALTQDQNDIMANIALCD